MKRSNPIRQMAGSLALLAAFVPAATFAFGQEKKPSAPVTAAVSALPSHVSLPHVSPKPKAPTVEASMRIDSPLGMDSQNHETEIPLHLLIGHSMFLKTTDRLHRVYVGSPKVLQSFIPSPKELVITAVAPGTSSVALWNTAGQSVLYEVSADLDVSKLRRSLKDALPGQEIHVDSQEGRVYLSGTVIGDDSYKQALQLASLYSKDVVSSLAVTYVHPQQVRLQVRIAEVDRAKLEQFGFNFFSGGNNTSSATTGQFSSLSTTQTSSTTPGAGSAIQTALSVSNPLNFFLYNSKLNIGATLADMEAHNVLQILAEPSITTVSGHEGDFLSGGEFPYPVIQGGAGNFASVTIMFRPYGVKVQFTPTVNPDGTILLKVAPEVSALDYTNTVTISGYTIPAISTRRAETEVELRNGQSFSISGLLDHRTTALLNKTPGIASVPILGELFKSKNNNHSVDELVVIVTASIVDPLHQETPTRLPKNVLPDLSVGKFDKSVNHAPDPDAEAAKR